MDYKYLQDYKRDDGSMGQRFCRVEDADYVILPINEFHGLKKAVRIVHDRALQQIDKSKTDEHGFRLLRADLRQYKRNSGKLWLITKETPYSSKIDLSTASTLIEGKLRELFVWTDTQDLDKYSLVELTSYKRYLSKSWDIAKIREQWHDDSHRDKWDFLGENTAEGKALYTLWETHPEMIVGISKISINYAQGLYEVSYWATEPI